MIDRLHHRSHNDSAPKRGGRHLTATVLAIGLALASAGSAGAAPTTGAGPFAGTATFHGGWASPGFWGCSNTPFTVDATVAHFTVDTVIGAYAGPASLNLDFHPYNCIGGLDGFLTPSSPGTFSVNLSGQAPSAGTIQCSGDSWNEYRRYRYSVGGRGDVQCTLNGQATGWFFIDFAFEIVDDQDPGTPEYVVGHVKLSPIAL